MVRSLILCQVSSMCFDFLNTLYDGCNAKAVFFPIFEMHSLGNILGIVFFQLGRWPGSPHGDFK